MNTNPCKRKEAMLAVKIWRPYQSCRRAQEVLYEVLVDVPEPVTDLGIFGMSCELASK